jgi:hypothetical protein
VCLKWQVADIGPVAAANPGFTHSEITRGCIRTSMLVNRLQNFVLGRGADMSPSQVHIPVVS